MIQSETNLEVADNSGARRVQCPATGYRGIRVGIVATVGEAVGRHVQNPHHQRVSVGTRQRVAGE